MTVETPNLEDFIKKEQMVVLKSVTFLCYQDRIRGLLVLQREHIAKRRERILPGEELCAVVYIEGVHPNVFHLENGHRLETSIDDFYTSMYHFYDRMCDKKVVVLLVSRPRIYD